MTTYRLNPVQVMMVTSSMATIGSTVANLTLGQRESEKMEFMRLLTADFVGADGRPNFPLAEPMNNELMPHLANALLRMAVMLKGGDWRVKPDGT